jgi:hypothetical protein
MALSIENITTINAYDALTTLPVGQTVIFPAADYAGTVTHITRTNINYWTVTTREIKNWSRNPRLGVSATVWQNLDGRWVVDYMENSQVIEVDETYGLLPAIGVAVFSTGHRGHRAGRW